MNVINLNFIPDYDALKQDPEFQRIIDDIASQHDQLATMPNDMLQSLVVDFVAAVFRHSTQGE